MRASARFAETGRYLEIGYLQSIKDKAKNAFEKYAQATINKDENGNTSIRTSETNAGRRGETNRLGADGKGNENLGRKGVFERAEWKSNEVGIGEEPVQVWSSDSGEPLPTASTTRNDTPQAKKVSENLEGDEKGSTFAPADEVTKRRLRVNITQNAGEDGGRNRLGDLNEKDRLEYKHALETLRRDDISDEERQAAEAAMDEIEQRRKEQMDAMVSAALEGIEGVSNVTTKAGIGVYTSTTGEVVEYTFEVEAEVEAGAEEAYRAAMASIAEVTRQDSFIVNYPDETPENATGEHDSAAQVRVKLDRPLSRTEQAQLTDMFSSLKLGLTITTDEISTSNFSNYGNDDFNALAIYLLDGFNNGDAKTTLHDARRVVEMGQLSTLPRAESALAGNGQGRVWSGVIERRTNYSTYYEAKGREYFIKKKGENERKDKGIRKDYADLKGKPAYHTEDKGNIPSTTVTPETIKGRVASAYNKSEDKKALSADFVLSAQPISDGYTTLQQEVEGIIDQAIADYESDTGKQWQGDRNELLERAAVFVRGMFLAADKRIGSKDKSGETRWNGIQTYVDEKLAEVENNQVVWDVLSEINARAEEKFVSMSKAARTEAAREFTTEIPERRRHMVASPVQAFAVQEENDKQREGGKKNSEEGLRDRIAKRKERDAEKKKKKEEERKKKEEERKKKAEEKAAKKAEEDAKQANERDRLAQALLDKHGSIAEYLKNTAIPDFTYKGKPITLFEYLTSTGKERKLINEEYARQHTITQLGAETTLEESADLATTVKQMLNEGANQVIYSKRIQIESGSGKKTTAISPKTSAKTLEAILAAEQEAKTTQHIKDGMAELGLELAEEKTQEPIDETNEATDETKLTDEPVEEEVVEEQPKPTKRGRKKQEVADEEELDDYERERENERADDEADEAFLRQQEAEFENQLGGKDKGQSRQSDEALRNDPEAVRQRIEFLEEKVDYEMATPEEEAELADLRQRLADMQSDPRFSIGSENRTAATPAQSAATQAVLDMLEKAGIEVEQVSDEEAMEILGEKNKSSLDTEIVEFANSPLKVSVISSEDGAKVLQNLETTKQKYQHNRNISNAVADIGRALGATHTGNSQYVTIEAKNGKVITIRISNHNATVSNFDKNGEIEGVSIAISRKPNNQIRNDGNAHIVEFFYSDKALNKADGSPIADIIGALEQTMYSGEYTDPTGLAVRQEVNIPAATPLCTPDGVVYGYVRNGKIYLTARGLNPNTPIHEYTHLWDTACQRANPELWKRGVELMKQLPLWEAIFIVFLQMHCNFSR